MVCLFKKQLKLIVFITFISALMLGCVSNEVSTFEDKHKLAEDKHKLAEDDLKKGNYEQAFRAFVYTLTKIVDGEAERKEHIVKVNKIIALYAKYPVLQQAIINYYDNSISNISYKGGFNTHLTNFKRLYKRKVITKETYTILVEKINTKIIQVHKSGDMKFNFGDNISKLEIFQTEQYQTLLYKNSLELLDNKHRKFVAKQIFRFAKDKGLDSKAMELLDEAIENNKIHYSILKNEFSKIFPLRAEKLANKLAFRIKIENQSSDELLIFDLTEKIQKLDSLIQLAENEGEKFDYTLQFKGVKISERHTPEKTSTVRYSRDQVNFLSGALLMPRNSTYAYNYTEGGYKVNYFGVIFLKKKGNIIAKERISGEFSETYSYCDNARIRNVFGGESSADFIANNQMQSQCSNNTKSIDTDNIYQKAVNAIFNIIKNMEVISTKI